MPNLQEPGSGGELGNVCNFVVTHVPKILSQADVRQDGVVDFVVNMWAQFL